MPHAAVSYYPPYYPSSSADEARTRAQKWEDLTDLLAKVEAEHRGIFQVRGVSDESHATVLIPSS